MTHDLPHPRTSAVEWGSQRVILLPDGPSMNMAESAGDIGLHAIPPGTTVSDRVSVRIGDEGRRIFGSVTAAAVVVRMITVSPGAPSTNSGRIDTVRLPPGTDLIHACMDRLIAVGSQEIDRIYAGFQLAHRRWRDGCPGMRPRSSAAWSAMLTQARAITGQALAYAAAFLELRGLERVKRDESGIPDWLDSALEDIRLGNQAEAAAHSLVKMVTAD